MHIEGGFSASNNLTFWKYRPRGTYLHLISSTNHVLRRLHHAPAPCTVHQDQIGLRLRRRRASPGMQSLLYAPRPIHFDRFHEPAKTQHHHPLSLLVAGQREPVPVAWPPRAAALAVMEDRLQHLKSEHNLPFNMALQSLCAITFQWQCQNKTDLKLSYLSNRT